MFWPYILWTSAGPFKESLMSFRGAWLLDAIFWSGKSPSWSTPIKFLVVLFPTNMFFRWFKFQILSFDQKKCCISTSSLLGWGFEISNKAREFLCSKLNNQFCLLGKRWFLPIIFVEYVFFCLFVGSNFLISITYQIYWVLAGSELEHHTSANTIKIIRVLYVFFVGHFLWFQFCKNCPNGQICFGFFWCPLRYIIEICLC